jgi:YHS domain-containing protein
MKRLPLQLILRSAHSRHEAKRPHPLSSQKSGTRPGIRRRLRVGWLALGFCVALTSRSGAAESASGKPESSAAAVSHYNLSTDKVAIKGYDPAGYFTKNQALRGRKELSAQHQGVTYWFATEENRKLFLESPEKYLPTYGGWCATAMAKGEKVEIDPTNFKVTNGRLFLFFRAFYANAIKDWNKDEPGMTAKADAHWKRIAGE